MPMTKSTNHPNSRRRLPRLSRVADANRVTFRMTARDEEILRAVYRFRVLTSVQIERLLFLTPGKPKPSNTRCNLRLQGLFHHGFLARSEQVQKITDGRKPLLYFLDRRGAEYLAAQDEIEVTALDWRPSHNRISPLFLDHLLQTNDVRIDIELACKLHSGYSLGQWIDDRALKEHTMREYVVIAGARGQGRRVAVIPDGFFIIQDADDSRYPTLLEVDMGTESSRMIKQKVAAYREFEKSGRYSQKYGAGRATMRVLFVTTSDVRMRNMKRATEAVGGKYNFWFSTFAQVTAESFLHAPIWYVPGYPEPMAFATD